LEDTLREIIWKDVKEYANNGGYGLQDKFRIEVSNYGEVFVYQQGEVDNGREEEYRCLDTRENHTSGRFFSLVGVEEKENVIVPASEWTQDWKQM